jgi:galactose mutarotase-like enzyme
MSIAKTVSPAGMEVWVLKTHRSQVSVLPERGALVSQWRVDERELLFLDETTVADRTKNVRGGIPLLFPNAGPLEQEEAKFEGRPIRQPQHGFARRHRWKVVDSVSPHQTSRLVLEFEASDATRATFPFEFRCRYAVSLNEATLALEWTIENRDSVAMPCHAGLHPYFAVPLAEKAAARVPSSARNMQWRGTGLVEPFREVAFGDSEIDVAVLEHRDQATLELKDQAIDLTYSKQFSTLVLWTLPGQPFICVEPWTAPAGALKSGSGLIRLEPRQQTSLVVGMTLRQQAALFRT